MATATEDLLKQLKRADRSPSILVPLIESFLQRPIDIDDDKDRQYLNDLILARSQPRKQGVYSPSMLAGCVRQVYFAKTGVKRERLGRIESSGYFLDGNFRHFKWQFAIWKMHRAGIIDLINCDSLCLGTEVYVHNKKGDFGGTIDNVIYIPLIDMVVTVDWKGMNGNSFLNSVNKGPSMTYILQSIGYAALANYTLRDLLPKRIEAALVIGENKNGPIKTRLVNSPLGLREWRFDLEDYRMLAAQRLKTLRSYERKGETPPPECVSTRRQMFKDCDFSRLCRGEVETIERVGQRLKLKTATKPKVSFSRNGKIARNKRGT